MAGILPPELILEILSWLPVTSLMRFRCLSSPELDPKYTDFKSMGILNDCLCVLLEIESTIIALFALKDVRDERSWSWLLNVSYETLNISPYLHQLQILGMLGDLLLLSYTYLDASNIIITFNFKENKVEHTQTYYRKFIFSCNYVPSLILSV
ncbi:uncharacterized protein LOC106768631 isoform X2 [Vigna radiata var. radiata]|uniref:Uncharacterized protein LOC106768631 isoform X2 n=1 Tax=Vigna radiata var. radiata TaxID=3916 RepID=A0A3Q0ESV8_VIGRR|nr:uncharacterized protein LOC106768631 isoform X2 [Vigna radiata var. radiata]